MVFTYYHWDDFCKLLHENQVHSIPARKLMHEHPADAYVILKHDVETNVESALRIAEIEHRWGHSGSYYVQAYLLEMPKNVEMLRQMQSMGHEISYHYDVMDANAGSIPAAIADFESTCDLFIRNGFPLQTLCQHGNPIVERKGYTSNRDFFRNEDVQKKFPAMADIMVDFKQKAVGTTDYLYFSDAGRQFKLIYDPINNDLFPSDEKNIPFDNLKVLWAYASRQEQNCIISIHPHRWVASKGTYLLKTGIFQAMRLIAKSLARIPLFKRIMGKYYYLAKKF